MSLADAALAALPEGAERVAVIGQGDCAQELRVALGGRADTGAGPPAAVIETTGEPERIREALASVDALGTVVLAGPPPDAMALDLYPDLHVRGITLIGVPAADEAGR